MTGRKSASEKEMDRQNKRREAGICRYCPNPLTTYSTRCVGCHAKHRERERARKSCKAWVRGGKGRPPKDVK